MKRKSIFFVFSLLILCTEVFGVLAKAPDTAKIAFVSNRDGNREIYIMNPDGTEKVRLTQNFSVDLYPTWSPNGEEILFVSDRDGSRDLYLMDADGSNVRRALKKSARREHPTWSPDGKRIAYERGGFIYIATLGKQEEKQSVPDKVISLVINKDRLYIATQQHGIFHRSLGEEYRNEFSQR